MLRNWLGFGNRNDNNNNNNNSDDEMEVEIEENIDVNLLHPIINTYHFNPFLTQTSSQESFLQRHNSSYKPLIHAFGQNQYFIQGNINTQISKKMENDEFIIKIASGSDYTIMLTNKNKLLGFGKNKDGQLGLGRADDFVSEITEIPLDCFKNNTHEKVIDICCGLNHTIALTNFSNIIGCGWNNSGQLGKSGNGSNFQLNKIFTKSKNVKMIRCGSNMSLILTNRDVLYGTGETTSVMGRLHEFTIIKEFKDILSEDDYITNFECGACHSVFLTCFKKLFIYGSNMMGQLGGGSSVKAFDNIVEWKKTDLPFNEKVLTIACGLHHTILLTERSRIFVCGYNDYGQLGTGDFKDRDKLQNIFNFYKLNVYGKFEKVNLQLNERNERIVGVYCGSYHTLFISNEDNFYSCGWNKFGQLGFDDHKHNRNSPNQLVLKTNPGTTDTLIFTYPAAHNIIFMEISSLNKFMYNCLLGRADDGRLGDIYIQCKHDFIYY
ncbi:hypothetical protein ABK040_016392 [Willaertia magna]